MNKPSYLKLSLLAALLCACVTSCAKKPVETATVQGRWSGFEQGSTERITLTFTGGRFAYSDSKSNELGGGIYMLNETVQPRQMDLTFETIPSPEYVGKVSLAIYELQGSELKIAGSEPGITQRPTNIVGGQGVRTFTFKRE